MSRWTLTLTVLLLLLFSIGCSHRASSGFKLPAGNVKAGEVAFGELGCATCHSVPGSNIRPPNIANPVVIGGRSPIYKTMGELTTAIIVPADAVTAGPSETSIAPHPTMPDLVDRMTVRQLADLVAFLEAHYQYAPMK